MGHKTKILEYRKLSDGQFSVLIQCCDDEQHTSWHTMHASVASDDAKRNASIHGHRERIAELHEHAIKAERSLRESIGEEIDHP
jgi:hypothetical protein